jgi:hypothetical protein
MRKKENPKPLEDKALKIYGRFLDKMAHPAFPRHPTRGRWTMAGW